jgi:hypothetical protein
MALKRQHCQSIGAAQRCSDRAEMKKRSRLRLEDIWNLPLLETYQLANLHFALAPIDRRRISTKQVKARLDRRRIPLNIITVNMKDLFKSAFEYTHCGQLRSVRENQNVI